MKISFRLILAILAATVALTACTKEITPNFENDKVNPEGSRVIAVSFGPQTKTRLDGLQPKFNDGDSIFLCTKADKQEDIVTDIRRVTVDDCGNATIITELTGELVAWYPARAVTYDDYTGGYNILNTPVQSGSFADANICSAAIDETAKKATFENEYALFIVTPPDGAQSLTIKSLRVMGESGGQRTGSRKSINVSTINDSSHSAQR